MNDRTLFDVAKVGGSKCPYCDVVRDERMPITRQCPIDRARSEGEYIQRPKGCLNAHDPAHAPFPEGY